MDGGPSLEEIGAFVRTMKDELGATEVQVGTVRVVFAPPAPYPVIFRPQDIFEDADEETGEAEKPDDALIYAHTG